MDRPILCYYILNGCPESHWNEVIAAYCMEKGKEPALVKAFLTILAHRDPYGDLRQQMVRHILTQESIEQKIVCLYDKDNQLIQVY